MDAHDGPVGPRIAAVERSGWGGVTQPELAIMALDGTRRHSMAIDGPRRPSQRKSPARTRGLFARLRSSRSTAATLHTASRHEALSATPGTPAASESAAASMLGSRCACRPK